MGRPRKNKDTEAFKTQLPPEPRKGDPCRVCNGAMELDVLDGDGNPTGEKEICQWCQGTGVEPGENQVHIEPEDVTDEDIEQIERLVCFTTKGWGIISAKRIVAASCNHFLTKTLSRAYAGQKS